MGCRSGATFVRTALLKKEVAQSRQRVRHKLRLLLLRNPENDVYEALLGRGRGFIFGHRSYLLRDQLVFRKPGPQWGGHDAVILRKTSHSLKALRLSNLAEA